MIRPGCGGETIEKGEGRGEGKRNEKKKGKRKGKKERRKSVANDSVSKVPPRIARVRD